MALTLENGLRNVLADAIDTEVGSAGYMQFETSGDVEVATISFGNPAFDTAGTGGVGVIQLNGTPLQDTNATGGAIEHFSIYKSGPTKSLEGTCGTSGADINMTSLTVAATETVTLSSFSITVPAS